MLCFAVITVYVVLTECSKAMLYYHLCCSCDAISGDGCVDYYIIMRIKFLGLKLENYKNLWSLLFFCIYFWLRWNLESLKSRLISAKLKTAS